VAANLMARADQPTAGVLVERSYIGKEYLANFRRATLLEGVQIVAEEPIAQTAPTVGSGSLHAGLEVEMCDGIAAETHALRPVVNTGLSRLRDTPNGSTYAR
jgi:hypothetical protein